MQYVVNGKVFDTLGEAQGYEAKLKERENAKNIKLQEYRDKIKEHLKIFRIEGSDSTKYVAVIAGDEHYKYAWFVAEGMFGRRFKPTSTGIDTRWSLKEIKNDCDLYDDAVSFIVSGKSINTYAVIKGNDVDISNLTEEKVSYNIDEFMNRLFDLLVF